MREDKSLSLLVRNLRYTTSPDRVRKYFEQFGEVRDVYLPLDFHTKLPRGFGFVEFAKHEDAEAALQALSRRTILDGSEVSVTIAQQGRKSPDSMRHRERSRYRDGYDRRYGRDRSYSPDRRRSYRQVSRSRSYHRRRDDSYSRHHDSSYHRDKYMRRRHYQPSPQRFRHDQPRRTNPIPKRRSSYNQSRRSRSDDVPGANSHKRSSPARSHRSPTRYRSESFTKQKLSEPKSEETRKPES